MIPKRNLNEAKRNLTVLLAAFFLLILMACGCVRCSTRNSSGLSPTVTDPTATQLHELCGELLKYYMERGFWPESLEELPAPKEGSLLAEGLLTYFMPPKELSGRPGNLLILAPKKKGLAIQGEPARWAVLLSPKEGGSALALQVVLLREREIIEALRPK